jgi:hypothetical protein
MTRRRVTLFGILAPIAVVLGLGKPTMLTRSAYLGTCVRQGPTVFVAVDVGPFRATMLPISGAGAATRWALRYVREAAPCPVDGSLLRRPD